MSKSEEIANELMNTQFGSTRHEAAAHILAQEAKIERLTTALAATESQMTSWQRIAQEVQSKRTVARLQEYDTRLTEVMPPDFKDWHENSKQEWPEIAAWVISNLRSERDEYQQAADKMAAEHKVERERLYADNKSYCSANIELLNVSSGLIDALHDCAKALDSAHGFLEFIWREVPLNDWASVQRDLAEKDIDEAIKRVKEVLK